MQGISHITRLWLILIAYGPALCHAQSPPSTGAAQAAYQAYLATNLPRAFATGPGSAFGWGGGTGTTESVQAAALAVCAARIQPAPNMGACRLYATDLAIAGQPASPVPGPLRSTWNYSLDPDARFVWRGPAAAAGVYLWAHGSGVNGSDARGEQPQSHVRAFNNAGFDIVRFDRDPIADRDRDRVAGWMADGLTLLRSLGYKRVVVGGHSRGAWNALMMLRYPYLADVIIAIAPAAHGGGGSTNLSAQYDDLRRIVADVRASDVRASDVRASAVRVAFVQFAGDAFAADMPGRRSLMERLRPKVGSVLIIDQPGGLTGHYASNETAFAERYGPCLLQFALGGPDHC